MQRHRPGRPAGPRAVLRPDEVAQRGRYPAPRLRRRQLVLAHLRPVGPVRQRQAPRRLHRRRVAAPAPRCGREDRDRRARPQDDERRFRRRRGQVHPPLHRRRRERRQRAQEGDRRPVHDLGALPRVRGHPAERGRPHGAGRRPHPPAGRRAAADRPARAAAHPADRRGRAAGRRGRRPGRRPGRHGTGLPHPGPGDLHAVRRGVPAGQDGPPPRVVAGRRHECATNPPSGCTPATSAA